MLSLDEVGAIWRASHVLDQPWGSFLRLPTLTAQRRGDVAGMRWREIDGTRLAISGDRTKNRRPHTYILPHLRWTKSTPSPAAWSALMDCRHYN